MTGYVPPRDLGDWKCPAHSDNRPSLSVRATDERVLMFCHAGCAISDVLGALSLSEQDLFDKPVTANGHDENWTPFGQAIARYQYRDEKGDLLYEVCRTENKEFPVRTVDRSAKQGWSWKLGDTRRVLFRLPQVIEAIAQGRVIWIVEGERDVLAMERAGEVATCNLGGAGKWRPDYADFFAGAHVHIIRDKDTAGYNHGEQVMNSLRDRATNVVLWEAGFGKDASDHLATGRTLSSLVRVSLPAEVKQGPLERQSIAELIRQVDASPHPGWLARPVWPADSHGVIGAEQKLGKTWMVLDLVVSVASDGVWLESFPVENPGPVLVFLGEGGERKMLRRLRAIAELKKTDLESLPIELCMRVPHLTQAEHLEIVAQWVDELHPRLVVVDPLYLAARGAKGSDLYAMGEHLEEIQHLTQKVGAALVIVHHWNKTGEGTGAARMSGAGPAEWGRVLVSASVVRRATHPVTQETSVTINVEFTGDEIPETDFRFIRKVSVDDPNSLDSPMHYSVEKVETWDEPHESNGSNEGLSPAARNVAKVLRGLGRPVTVRRLGDALAEMGTPLRPRTIQKALISLKAAKLAIEAGESFAAQVLWRPDEEFSDEVDSEAPNLP